MLLKKNYVRINHILIEVFYLNKKSYKAWNALNQFTQSRSSLTLHSSCTSYAVEYLKYFINSKSIYTVEWLISLK